MVFQCFLAHLSLLFRRNKGQSSIWYYCVQPLIFPYGSKYGAAQLHTNQCCRRFLRHRQRKLRIISAARLRMNGACGLLIKHEVERMALNQSYSPLIAPSLSNLVAKIKPEPFFRQIISGAFFNAQKESSRNARVRLLHFAVRYLEPAPFPSSDNCPASFSFCRILYASGGVTCRSSTTSARVTSPFVCASCITNSCYRSASISRFHAYQRVLFVSLE